MGRRRFGESMGKMVGYSLSTASPLPHSRRETVPISTLERMGLLLVLVLHFRLGDPEFLHDAGYHCMQRVSFLSIPNIHGCSGRTSDLTLSKPHSKRDVSRYEVKCATQQTLVKSLTIHFERRTKNLELRRALPLSQIAAPRA